MNVSESACCPLKPVVYRSFEALKTEWNPLLSRNRFNSFFLTYEWQTTWWSYLGHGDLWIMAFRETETDELIALFPLYHYIRPAYSAEQNASSANSDVSSKLAILTLVGCIEVSDYLDAIIAEGWEREAYNNFVEWLRSNEAPQWDRLDLCNLPEASHSYKLGAEIFSDAGWSVKVQQEDVAPQFMLPLRYEEYLADQVEKKQRHEIRRKRRKAERETIVDFYIVGLDPEMDKLRDIEAEIDEFIRLQRASRDDKAEFMSEEMARFFKGMARNMLNAGYLRLCFLSINGERAAALFAFEYNDSFLLYNSGYDPDLYQQYSPGWVITAYTIQYAIAAGLRLYDFMQGDEEYKYRFGGEDYKVMRVLVDQIG